MINIETDNLILTSLKQNDWDMFYRLYTDTRVTKLCFDQPSDKEIQDKFKSRLKPWITTSDNWLCLSLKEKKSQTTFGITGFFLNDGVAEIGYLLNPEFHGRNFATESLFAVIHWAQQTHNITHFQAIVSEGNIASERVLEKCGFTLSQIKPNAYKIGNKLYADYVYKMSNGEQQ